MTPETTEIRAVATRIESALGGGTQEESVDDELRKMIQKGFNDLSDQTSSASGRLEGRLDQLSKTLAGLSDRVSRLEEHRGSNEKEHHAIHARIRDTESRANEKIAKVEEVVGGAVKRVEDAVEKRGDRSWGLIAAIIVAVVTTLLNIARWAIGK